ITGQFLISRTRTPNQPDVTSSWTGENLSSRAGLLQWSHNTTHADASASYKDIGEGFRADTGFVPQVGIRETSAEQGYTFRPKGFLSRLRTFLIEDRQVDRTGALISREVSPGAGMDTRLNGFMRFRYANDKVRSGNSVFGRQQFVYVVQFSPSRLVPQISADGFVGQEIDFANSRPGRGTNINLNVALFPTSHLELRLLQSERRLVVHDQTGVQRHLFTADVSRVRGTYTFPARSFVRLIGQYVSPRRDPT